MLRLRGQEAGAALVVQQGLAAAGLTVDALPAEGRVPHRGELRFNLVTALQFSYSSTQSFGLYHIQVRWWSLVRAITRPANLASCGVSKHLNSILMRAFLSADIWVIQDCYPL